MDPSPRLLLAALAAGAVLAGCGAGSTSTKSNAHAVTLTSSTGGPRSRHVEPGRPAAVALTREEMREYDANEGRCQDDGGRVRNVGTLDAYCAFPDRSNDFHLIESSQQVQLSGEEE